MRHVNKFVAATLGAMALAGCGGSSGTSSSANAQSGAQFVSQVNRICSDVNAKVGALPAIQTQADLLTTGARELSMSSTALAELKALTPPAGKQAAVTLNPLTMSQMPSDSSEANSGTVAIACAAEPRPMMSSTTASPDTQTSGPPTSPNQVMPRGTRPDRYIR